MQSKRNFNRLLLCGANSFVLLHNHPSGDTSPSKEDIAAFKRIKQCSELLGINFLDNIIVGDNYYSFIENNYQ
jgi:DNA repair protein RadC